MRSSVAVVAKRLTHSKQEGVAGAPQKGRVVRVKLRDLEAVLPGVLGLSAGRQFEIEAHHVQSVNFGSA